MKTYVTVSYHYHPLRHFGRAAFAACCLPLPAAGMYWLLSATNWRWLPCVMPEWGTTVKFAEQMADAAAVSTTEPSHSGSMLAVSSSMPEERTIITGDAAIGLIRWVYHMHGSMHGSMGRLIWMGLSKISDRIEVPAAVHDGFAPLSSTRCSVAPGCAITKPAALGPRLAAP